MTPAVHLCLPGTPRGGGLAFCCPPLPSTCVGLDGGMTSAVHLCLPATPKGTAGGLAFCSPPPPLHAVGRMGG